jgi:hypothetical protein
VVRRVGKPTLYVLRGGYDPEQHLKDMTLDEVWAKSFTRRMQTCMGLFLSSGLFWVALTVFCSERERPFFVPSPAIRFAERAEGVKGPKR